MPTNQKKPLFSAVHPLINWLKFTLWTQFFIFAFLFLPSYLYSGIKLKVLTDNDFEKKIKPKKITVYVLENNTKKVLWTKASNVKELLATAGIGLNKLDRVYPPLNTETHHKMRVEVVRVETKIKTVKEVIPYQTIVKRDHKMLWGKIKVEREGKEGLRIKKIKAYYKNGKKTLEKVIATNVVRPPVNKIVAKGTLIVLASRNCRVKKVLNMIATAYAPFHCGGHPKGITRTGIKATYGIVAVDPRVIPLGTRVYIPGYGQALAADTGGAISGMRIDLCFDKYEEVIRFGRKKVKVYILE